MKTIYIFLILIIFAWPLYYLYQLQLGAVSFLLLAIFFTVISVKELKKYKRERGIQDLDTTKRRK
ncbi:hypothetical protein RCG23_12725 [Neobacillus sp. PS3-34]|uniref:hypothetical protein n=1 Tax=Neobacillus sp. PS3-34 TaxID=3070678 RepID=UPI0027DF4C09|nr:hypothetical protein [Neobacillus sp. PS3-34]WML50480.1 hypothetical protein RCG23_12725 [Neobacillus sp. PS3-34]